MNGHQEQHDPLYGKTSGALTGTVQNEYINRLRKEFPESPVFYPFKRILMSGILS